MIHGRRLQTPPTVIVDQRLVHHNLEIAVPNSKKYDFNGHLRYDFLIFKNSKLLALILT